MDKDVEIESHFYSP